MVDKADTSAASELTPQQQQLIDMGLVEKPVVDETQKEEIPAETEHKENTPEHVEAEKNPLKDDPDWVKLTDGKFKSKIELDTFLQEHEKIKGEFEPIKNKYTQAEEQIKKLKETNPFEDDEDLYKVYRISKETGRKDYNFLLNIVSSDVSQMSAIDALKAKELFENAEIYKGKESLLERSLMRQYDIEKPSNFEDLEPDEQKEIEDKVELNTLKMEKDAKAAKQFLTDLKGKYKYEQPNIEDVEKQKEEKAVKFIATWKPITESIEKGFKSIAFNDNGFTVDIPIREEDKQIKEQVFSELANYLFANAVEPTEENLAKVNELVENRFIELNKKYVFAKIGEIARSYTEDAWRKIVNNPYVKKDENPPVEKELTPQQKAILELQTK